MRDDEDDDTVIRRPRTPRTEDRTDAEIGDTVIRPVPPQPGAVGSAPADDTVIRHDPARSGPGPADDTVVRSADPHLAQGDPGGGAAPRLPADAVATTKRVPSIRVGGRILRLDRPVVIGRRPALPRITLGPTPELVTVPSRSGQVSSSHVMVHAEGEAAVVDDLRSTNGTVVRPPGAAPFRMPAGASNVVLTGTVVEIGDGNVIEVLSPHLRVAPSSEDFPPRFAWPSDPPAGTPRPPESDPET